MSFNLDKVTSDDRNNFIEYNFKKCNSILEGVLIPPQKDVNVRDSELTYESYDFTYTITWCGIKIYEDTIIEKYPSFIEEPYGKKDKSSSFMTGNLKWLRANL